MQPTRSLLLRASLVFGALVIVVLAVGLIFNYTAGLAAGLAILLLVWLLHLRQLGRLMYWARQPLGTAVPDGFGVWSDVFAALYRRTREQREQREALQRMVERFRNVAQTLPDGVVILGDDGSIEWLNSNAESHLGLSGQHDTGYPISNLLRDETFVAYLHNRQFGASLELRPMRSPGRVLSLQLIPFGESQMMLLSRDIGQLEKLEVMRRDFVANVSHELKTPLTVVAGFVETLADDYENITPEDARHFLSLASDQAGRMQRLIEDLLVLSALETSAPPQREEVVDVAALLADVRGEAQNLSGGKHTIVLEQTGSRSLLGSAKELRSAFGNLAVNAVRYTPEGGIITLHWQGNANDGATFSVTDTGLGIAAEHLPRLTERFYRVDRGRSRDMGGTGLGLAIVKHALERHQATLQIDSEPGKGSKFTASFPARRVRD